MGSGSSITVNPSYKKPLVKTLVIRPPTIQQQFGWGQLQRSYWLAPDGS